MSAELSALETEAKLQMRLARAQLRLKLGMWGNVLLTTWALSLVILLVWFAMCTLVPAWETTWSLFLPMLRVDPDYVARINLLGMMGWKLVSYLFFLLPGLALKICAHAMGKA